jgi:hypothetical protein
MGSFGFKMKEEKTYILRAILTKENWIGMRKICDICGKPLWDSLDDKDVDDLVLLAESRPWGKQFESVHYYFHYPICFEKDTADEDYDYIEDLSIIGVNKKKISKWDLLDLR